MTYKEFTELVEELATKNNITVDDAFQNLIKVMVGITALSLKLLQRGVNSVNQEER